MDLRSSTSASCPNLCEEGNSGDSSESQSPPPPSGSTGPRRRKGPPVFRSVFLADQLLQPHVPLPSHLEVLPGPSGERGPFKCSYAPRKGSSLLSSFSRPPQQWHCSIALRQPPAVIDFCGNGDMDGDVGEMDEVPEEQDEEILKVTPSKRKRMSRKTPAVKVKSVPGDGATNIDNMFNNDPEQWFRDYHVYDRVTSVSNVKEPLERSRWWLERRNCISISSDGGTAAYPVPSNGGAYHKLKMVHFGHKWSPRGAFASFERQSEAAARLPVGVVPVQVELGADCEFAVAAAQSPVPAYSGGVFLMRPGQSCVHRIPVRPDCSRLRPRAFCLSPFEREQFACVSVGMEDDHWFLSLGSIDDHALTNQRMGSDTNTSESSALYDVSWSPHPKCIYVAVESGVSLFDLRASLQSQCQKYSYLGSVRDCLPESCIQRLAAKSDLGPFFLGVTDKRVLFFDQRRPDAPVETFVHQCVGVPDYMHLSDPCGIVNDTRVADGLTSHIIVLGCRFTGENLALPIHISSGGHMSSAIFPDGFLCLPDISASFRLLETHCTTELPSCREYNAYCLNQCGVAGAALTQLPDRREVAAYTLSASGTLCVQTVELGVTNSVDDGLFASQCVTDAACTVNALLPAPETFTQGGVTEPRTVPVRRRRSAPRTAQSRRSLRSGMHSAREVQSQPDAANELQCAGFRGSFSAAGDKAGESSKYDSGHVTMTYSCLCCLLILGDDLSRVNRERILTDLAKCQKTDGSFCALPVAASTEADVRYVFCAAAVRYLLNGDDSCFDVRRALQFISSSLSFEGGFGQGPSLEAHGGSTYCCVAALSLLHHLWDDSVLKTGVRRRLAAWALRRQTTGMHGRANKPDDSCYSFWILATLKILQRSGMVNSSCVRRFTLDCQDKRVGGFSKYPECESDLLHASFSVSGLAMLNEPGLNPINPSLNITLRACERLHAIQHATPQSI